MLVLKQMLRLALSVQQHLALCTVHTLLTLEDCAEKGSVANFVCLCSIRDMICMCIEQDREWVCPKGNGMAIIRNTCFEITVEETHPFDIINLRFSIFVFNPQTT